MNMKKYKVYIEGTGHGCFRDYREFVGFTKAVSSAKAISNVRYRRNKQGKYLPNDIEDAYGFGYITFKYVAELAE